MRHVPWSTHTFAVWLVLLLAGCAQGPRIQLSRAPVPPPAEDLGEEDAAEWFLKRRLPPGESELPADRYTAAVEHVARMPKYAPGSPSKSTARAAAGHTWTSLGPGNIGSRIRSLVINPKDPNVMYAGAVTGGVWKSVDGGANWAILTDGLPTLNIGALALDPADPSVIYAGTGESYDNRVGAGVFKSVDAGSTWMQLPSTASGNAFLYTNRIVISPKNSLRIYAATRQGIFSTNNGGATWQKSPIDATWYGCQDLAIRTDTPTDYLFAACSGPTSAATFSVWRNTDAAGSGIWTAVYTAAKMGRTVIALAPSQPSTIYAAAAGDPTSPRDGVGLAGVFRSTSNGDPGTWTTQVSGSDPNIFNTLLFSGIRAATNAFCSGGAVAPTTSTWGKMMAVDPLDPIRVWVGGVDLFRSDDGGVTWGVASEFDYQAPQFSHADRHVLVFHPAYDGTSNQTAFQATDGGLYRTDNARAAVSTGPRAGCMADYLKNSAVTWTHIDNSLVGTQFYHGAAYPGGGAYLGGAQDNGVNVGWDGQPNSWANKSSGDGGAVAIDPADASLVWYTTQGLALMRSVSSGGFTPAIAGITENPSKFPFEAYLAADPNEGRRLYLGGTTNLWQSVDGAVSWTAAAPVEANSSVSAIAVSPFDSNTVFFGTAQGYIYSSASALASAGSTPWASSRPRPGNVAGITFDPTNPSVIYATYSSLKSATSQAHVYKSIDGGQTWIPSDGSAPGSVPDIGVWKLLIDPGSSATLYLGTDLGLLVSQDAGATWAHDNGLPAVYVEDLGLDPAVPSNWLFAFTFGRGMFKTPLPGATIPDCTFSVSPQSVAADRFGGVFPVAVTTQPGCTWSAVAGRSQRFPIQSPAQGSGSATAFVVVPPNIDTPAQTDTLIVAGAPVVVSQAAQAFQNVGSDLQTAAPLIAIPSMIRRDTRLLTASPDDPVHSCTGSADFKTAWWKVAPTDSGVLRVLVRGDRLDVFGDFGTVLTVYAQSAPTVELACATVPKNNNARTPIAVQFNVTPGETYLIEVSATGSAAQDGGNATVVVTPGVPAPSVSITPPALIVAVGGGPQQFSAQVSGADNQGVRWSVAPPIGLISPGGVYSPPPSLTDPVNVTITATSFADPSQSASAVVTVTP
jgi:hypothetical protein